MQIRASSSGRVGRNRRRRRDRERQNVPVCSANKTVAAVADVYDRRSRRSVVRLRVWLEGVGLRKYDGSWYPVCGRGLMDA